MTVSLNKEKVLDALTNKVYAIYSHSWNYWYYWNIGILVFKLHQKEVLEEFIKLRTAHHDNPRLEIKKVSITNKSIFCDDFHKPILFCKELIEEYSRPENRNIDYKSLYKYLGENNDNQRSYQ